MRKLLILMLVLGMASMANAALSLLVGGADPGPGITLDQSDTIWIGVDNVSPTGQGMFDVFVIVAEDGGGPEAGGSWTSASVLYTPPGVPAISASYFGYMTGFGDTWYLVNSSPTTHVAGAGLTGEFEFHCDLLLDDVVVNLVDAGTFQVLDSLAITQIPEPMTMALLGFGALLLRRRK